MYKNTQRHNCFFELERGSIYTLHGVGLEKWVFNFLCLKFGGKAPKNGVYDLKMVIHNEI